MSIVELLTHKMIAKFKGRITYPVDRFHGCWEWAGALDWAGYGRFTFIHQRKRTAIKAHRMSWAIHNKRDPAKVKIIQDCNNRKCCNPYHLSEKEADWLDSVERAPKNPAKGSRHGNSKITQEIVAEIQRLASEKVTHADIGKELRLAQSTVSDVLNKKAGILSSFGD